MVGDSDKRTGTHAHMGKAVWDGPYAYRQPIHVWTAHMHMGCLYVYGLPIRAWAKYLYGTEQKHSQQVRILHKIILLLGLHVFIIDFMF